jgi:hypothetical protein
MDAALNSSAPAPAPIDATELLDFGILRAQLVNCLFQAFYASKEAGSTLTDQLTLGEIEDMALIFSVCDAQNGFHTFRIALRRPDGSEITVQKFSPEGDRMPLEAEDLAFAEAFAEHLGGTVGSAYKLMVKEPVKPTHAGSSLLQ